MTGQGEVLTPSYFPINVILPPIKRKMAFPLIFGKVSALRFF